MVRVTLSNEVARKTRPDVDVLDLDQALRKLSELDVKQAQMVELRYFAGMTLEEIGAVTGVSIASTHRRLRSARAWMRQHFENESGGGAGGE